MKKQIVLDKGVILAVIFIILGIIVFFWGSDLEKKIDNPVALKEMTSLDCETLNYVDGEITAYLTSWEYDATMEGNQKDGTQKTTGISGHHNILLTNYEIYTIPLKDGKYIRILAGKDDTQESLENFTAAVPFHGFVIKTSKAINSEWYSKIDKFNSASVITDYMIMECNGNNFKSIKYLGLAMAGISLLVIITKVVK